MIGVWDAPAVREWVRERECDNDDDGDDDYAAADDDDDEKEDWTSADIALQNNELANFRSTYIWRINILNLFGFCNKKNCNVNGFCGVLSKLPNEFL